MQYRFLAAPDLLALERAVNALAIEGWRVLSSPTLTSAPKSNPQPGEPTNIVVWIVTLHRE